MSPTLVPEQNVAYTAPEGLDESQVQTIPAHTRIIEGGNMDGERIVVVAWMPSKEEVEKICMGHPIFITMVGGLAPHYPSIDFEQATHPQ